MEKKNTPKKATSKKSQVKATTKKAAPKKNNQVVKTQKKEQTKLQNFNKKDANTGYILGLSSLIAWAVPIIGTIVTITGIYCCYKGMRAKKGVATIGLILNILFLTLALVNIEADFALLN